MFDFDRLTINDVSRYYGRRCALAHVSLTLRTGEVVALLGPNGAGKSTLLALLATLIRPSVGSIRYGDQSAAEVGLELRAQVGFLSHDLQLYAELTARENLEFFAGLYGLNDSSRRVSEALERAGLELRADDVVDGYSRGMRQRLALERTLLHNPRLDQASSHAFAKRLRDLHDAHAIVLMATHDLDVVDGLVDRSVMLRSGELIELEDDGDCLREQYRNALARGD